MFRRLQDRLPPDHTFPADLEKLGYLVTEKDQIRQTGNPSLKYQYKINRNDRVNEVYKEAMNSKIVPGTIVLKLTISEGATRQIVLKRLTEELGLVELRLPFGATKTDKHIPILVSPNLETKKNVIVYFSERHSDLGILSYRVIGEDSINYGSIYNFVKSTLQDPNANLQRADVDGSGTDNERPGIIIANVGQLIWYRGEGRAVSDREWSSLPRPSAVHSPLRLDEIKNRVEGNEDFRAHIRYIFQKLVLGDSPETAICHPDAKVSVIGQEWSGAEALEYLTVNWPTWRDRVSCVALINPQHNIETLLGHLDPNNPSDAKMRLEISNFVAKRCRAYRLHDKPLEARVSGRSEFGCNAYSAGESLYEESCIVRCWPSVLDWIALCNFSTTFEEPDVNEQEKDDSASTTGQEAERQRYRSPRKPLDDDLAAIIRHHEAPELEHTSSLQAS